MSEQIYIITKSLTVNEEEYYHNLPSTYANDAESAAILLKKTLKRLQEWNPDLEVLGQGDLRLHVRYTDGEGCVNDASYWAVAITKCDSFAW